MGPSMVRRRYVQAMYETYAQKEYIYIVIERLRTDAKLHTAPSTLAERT